ncbi:MAG: hypothetical protein AB1776_02390 [Bacillota bacterium]
MLTERDREIIRLINRFGCLTAEQVGRLMGMGQRVTYRRLQKWSKAGISSTGGHYLVRAST